MEQTYRFPAGELLHYRHEPEPKAGEPYILIMANISYPGVRQYDYALRAKIARDGLATAKFTKEDLRKKKTDRDLYWITADEGNGFVSLYSPAANRYVSLTEQGATLSKKKALLKIKENGSFRKYYTELKDGTKLFLRCACRSEAENGIIFTSGAEENSSSFGSVVRVHGIPAARPKEKAKLTVGTLTDIHIDYGIQLFRPYIRKSLIRSCRGYRNRYDLDAMIIPGDTISDNGSSPSYPRGGARQGKWPRERFLRVQKLLDTTIRGSFRDADKARVLWLTGNHDHQVGDRQPEGMTYDSSDYSYLLPKDIKDPLFVDCHEFDIGTGKSLLCYRYEVKGYDFLILNNPLQPFTEGNRDRFEPGHNMNQAEWLEQQLAKIKKEKGNKAVVFVASHYPFRPSCYCCVSDGCPDNIAPYMRMFNAMHEFPNLFFFYGHIQGGDWHITLNKTAENMATWSKPCTDIKANEQGRYWPADKDSFERGRFCSDVISGTGFHENFSGGMVFYKTHFFANDGKKVDTWLTHLDLPFYQGCAIEVYEDRVILTMENFGTKAGVKDHLPAGSLYKPEPLVCPLVK